MLDAIAQLVGGTAAALLFFLFLVVFLWPVSLVYAVARHLHYMRRIADAAECQAYQARTQGRAPLAAVPEQGREVEPHIPLSAFGR